MIPISLWEEPISMYKAFRFFCLSKRRNRSTRVSGGATRTTLLERSLASSDASELSTFQPEKSFQWTFVKKTQSMWSSKSIQKDSIAMLRNTFGARLALTTKTRVVFLWTKRWLRIKSCMKRTKNLGFYRQFGFTSFWIKFKFMFHTWMILSYFTSQRLVALPSKNNQIIILFFSIPDNFEWINVDGEAIDRRKQNITKQSFKLNNEREDRWNMFWTLALKVNTKRENLITKSRRISWKLDVNLMRNGNAWTVVAPKTLPYRT